MSSNLGSHIANSVLTDDGQAALGHPGGLADGPAGQMRGGDVLADHRGPLAFGRAQAGEQAVGHLLGFVELAHLQVSDDAEGLEPARFRNRDHGRSSSGSAMLNASSARRQDLSACALCRAARFSGAAP